MRRIIASGTVLALGAVIASCSGSSSNARQTISGTSTGPVSSALSAPNRDPMGYTWGSESLSAVPGGRVLATTVAPSNTSLTLAAHAPLNQVALRGGGPAMLDNTFPAPAGSFAALQSDVFAATTSVGIVSSGGAGLGDVFRRVALTSTTGMWQVAYDSVHPEAVVGNVGSDVYAATGGPAFTGDVLLFSSATQTFASIAKLESSASPTAIAGLGGQGGQVFVGASNPTLGARLYRVSGGTSTPLPLQATGLITGGREQVSALLPVGLVAPGSGPGGSSALFYGDIVPILFSRCTQCHADSMNTAFLSYRLSPQAGSLSDYRKTINEVNLTNVPASDLLTQASGQNHPLILNITDLEYINLQTWIVQGARFVNPGGMTGSIGLNPPANSINGQAMVIAVAQLDANGMGLSGTVQATQDGATFEVLTTFSGEAPTGLAFADNTIYVATSAGRLYYRMGDGSWALESGIPATRGLYALTSVDGTRLALGAQTDLGPLAIDRFGVSAGMGGPVTPTFAGNVRPVLTARCVGCHGNPGIVGTAYPLTGNDATDAATTQARVIVATPDQSPLLLKATAQVPHGGGATITLNGPEYNSIRAWIAAGAPFPP